MRDLLDALSMADSARANGQLAKLPWGRVCDVGNSARCDTVVRMRARILLGVFVWCVTRSPSVLAANQDSYLLGDQAALVGGAVVATTHDGGAVYYNPAGLGDNDRLRLDVSANAYVRRVRAVERSARIRTRSTNSTQDLDGTTMLGVPTSLVYVRALRPGLSAGLGVFVTEQDHLKMTASMSDASVYGGVLERVAFERRITRYHFGPALGVSLSPATRIGASILGSYENLDQRSDTAVFAPSPTPEYRAALGDFNVTRISAEAAIGLQFNPSDLIRVGLMLRGPRLLLRESRKDLASETDAGETSQSLHVSQMSQESTDSFKIMAPPRAYAAVAFNGRIGWVSVEADLAPGLAARGLSEGRAPVWNVRAGVLAKLSRRWRAGGGIFSDRAYQSTPQVFPDYRVHYYGATIGLQTLHTVIVDDDQGDDANPKEEAFRRSVGHADARPALHFGTTLAFRYAVGLGEMAVLDIDTTRSSGSPAAGVERAHVTWHEFAVHLGTGLYF